jgi:transposase
VGDRPLFPPEVGLHLVKLACELPDQARRSLSTWTCTELARTLERDAIVESISPQSVRRMLESHRLRPWRIHHWLSSKTPRDRAFALQVEELSDLYTRTLDPWERVVSVDEKTSLQPRPRTSPTRPAQPGGVPVRLEHEYKRKGCLHLLAGFDIRTGEVIGILRRRKRQQEFIELLAEIERQTPDSISVIHVVCDNVSVHHGKKVKTWIEHHSRFRFHFTPVHCSWMNQVEQWFSILQRKRLACSNFADLADLEAKVLAFIAEWNQIAHPFRWTAKSFQRVLEKMDRNLRSAA